LKSVGRRYYNSFNSEVDPEWVTGLCDKSANFSIIVYNRKEGI